MKKRPHYSLKVRVKTPNGIKIVTLYIRHEGVGWNLYADDQLWAETFDFPDQAVDVAHWVSYPLPKAIGAEDPRASLGVSDQLSEWTKIAGQ